MGDASSDTNRARRAAKASRLGRTIVLGAIAAALGLWWLGRAYDVEPSQMLRFLVLSVVFVAGSMTLALVGALALRTLRRRSRFLGQGRPSRSRTVKAVKEDR